MAEFRLDTTVPSAYYEDRHRMYALRKNSGRRLEMDAVISTILEIRNTPNKNKRQTSHLF